jgi:ADP-dependent NAD(P)H-hydrate dehydratase / NAD(P)H-hydrate epimerase
MQVHELTSQEMRKLLPRRPPDGHKGTFGHVVVIGGSRGFTGAVKMTCEAAARSGVGLVTAAVPRCLADVFAVSLLEVMSTVLPDTPDECIAHRAVQPALDFAAGKNAVVLGPGMSARAEPRDFTLSFIRKCPLPMLIDADGLNNLSTDLSVLGDSKASRVLTPHPGEMGRLADLAAKDVQSKRATVATAFAQQHGCVVVLKGYHTIISDGATTCSNPSGNSGMATGGTGDVLSGIIGGLLAQGMDALEAALLGTYVHGIAGDLAAAANTERGMIAGDVITALPEAWRRLEEG